MLIGSFLIFGDYLKEYVNGVFINETTGSYFPVKPSGTYSLRFGADSKFATYFFKGYLDDIRIYNRALADLEIANISGYAGAIKTAKLSAVYSLADFELGTLDPIKFSDYWTVWNNSSAYIKVVENPVKSDDNSSDYVGVSVTQPSCSEDDVTKSEYVLTSANGLLDDHHHIMRWKILLADSTLLNIDTIVNDYMSMNQIHGGCQLNDTNKCQSGVNIAYDRGIFNDNVKANSPDKSTYTFRYRTLPDSTEISYNVDIGKWMSFTYEIFWTHSDTGYWSLWKDGILLDSANNVKTLPDCYDEDDDFLLFRTGLCNKWLDDEIDSFMIYFDDIELYIDQGQGLDIKEICSEYFRL